ncbi:hypothetical protein [Mocis latipes granulovirus]|uniref:Uncharacterized protein n=1 Tax=Mocis latipes granulovirus TaxID=2072024 RepID=A0A162GVM4_9BBAC|nr:hypothetical protein [Mocis latipes granulovirus]AKR17429.1 hypothetical protein [Mocis latipes granulovirus]
MSLIKYFCVFANCVIASLCSIKYDIVSTTVDNLTPCLSACNDAGQCYIDHHLNMAACYSDLSAGVPTFLTPFRPGVRQYCLSNCGKFGDTQYNWCYTTENYNWDYCNPVPYSPTEKWGRSVYGEKCIDDCVRGTYSLPKCHVANQDYVTCARPAKVSVQSCRRIFTNLRSKRSPLDTIFSSNSCSNLCRARVRDGYDGETMQRMQSVLSQGNSIYPVERIYQFPPNSPYTFVATRNETNSRGDMVYLPLVVQATLRQPPPSMAQRSSEDVPREAAQNVANMYDGDSRGRDTGHIIAFINGGTRDLFNFVSQTVATNRGPYKVIETFIRDWIYSGLGYADITVVIEYAGTTATQFAVKLKLYNNDHSLHSDCLDIIIDNI